MDADQEVDQVQRGQVLPWTKIFAWTYVLGVFLSYLLLVRGLGLTLGGTLVWSLLLPLGFVSVLLLSFSQYPLVTLTLGVGMLVGYLRFLKWLRYKNRRKAKMAITLTLAGVWELWIIYAATQFTM